MARPNNSKLILVFLGLGIASIFLYARNMKSEVTEIIRAPPSIRRPIGWKPKPIPATHITPDMDIDIEPSKEHESSNRHGMSINNEDNDKMINYLKGEVDKLQKQLQVRNLEENIEHIELIEHDDYEYTISHWDYGHWDYFYGPWKDIMEVGDCPVKCRVVKEFADKLAEDKNADVHVDALLSSLFVMAPDEVRLKATRNVLFLLEAKEKYGLKGVEPLFDWTSYYDRTSDIPFPYREFYNETAFFHKPGPKRQDTLVAAFISQCGSNQLRYDYIEELNKYIKVDHYGPCFHNVNVSVPKGDHRNPTPGKTPMDMLYDNKIQVLKEYKFTLAFENTFIEDYVTEKIYHPFMAASVPVYKGAPNIKEFLPGPHSAVLVDDFSGPKELAEYLTRVGNDDVEYKKFFDYQDHGLSSKRVNLVDSHCKNSLPCKVCIKMSEDKKFWSDKGRNKPNELLSDINVLNKIK